MKLLDCAVASAALMVGALAFAADDAEYPSKPLRLIVPQSPGSATDALTRVFAPKLAEVLGQAVVIDNRAGAGGVLGADLAAKSPPDGYTVLIGATAWVTVAPHLYKKIPYDPIADFAPVSLFALGQHLLVVAASSGIRTSADLIAQMKARPNQLNMASAGVGSSSQLSGTLFMRLANVSAVHVPYKGAGQSVVAVIAGEADWTFTPLAGPLPHVRSGKLRALAVGGAERSPILPEVPTVAETVLPEFVTSSWFGVMLPKGASTAIVGKLNAAVVKAVQSADLRDQLLTQGAEPKTNSPAEFAQFVRMDLETTRKTAQLAGVVPE